MVPHAVVAQHVDKFFQFGMVVSAAVDHTSAIKYFPEIYFSTNKTSLLAGPIFKNKNLSSDKKQATGFRICCQHFPHGHREVFNLFYEYEVSVLRSKFDDVIYLPSAIKYGGLKARATEEHSLGYYFGFGFMINAGKHFFITTNLGAGMRITEKTIVYKYRNGQFDQEQPASVPNYGGQFRIGLGYNFVTTKYASTKKRE
jgi:hypothetical protein